MVYEYLIEKAGYTHDDVYVFFGDGNDWEVTSINNYRYRLSVTHDDWPDDIVDYPNENYTDFKDSIQYFANNVITQVDNLIIWHARGHGSGSPTNEYADNGNTFIYVSDPLIGSWNFSENTNNPTNIYNTLIFEDENGNKKYKRKIILWPTCRSGHVIAGNKTFINGGDTLNDDDEKTIVLTSCEWSGTSNQYRIVGPYNDSEYHSGFTYAIYVTLMGVDPYGRDIDCDPDPDIEPDVNNDGVISMLELWNTIKSEEKDCLHDISWDFSPEPNYYDTRPQIADPGNMAAYLYIDEVLRLKNATLTLMQGEDIRYYRVDQIIAGGGETELVVPEDSNIKFVVDTEVRFKPGFHAEKGSQLHAFIGEMP